MPQQPATPHFLKHLAVWAFVCSFSAAPSFFLGSSEYSVPGMACGVGMFILGYTGISSTEWFSRFRRRPFMERTLRIGFGLRVLISILFPIALFVDIGFGIVSIAIAEALGYCSATTL